MIKGIEIALKRKKLPDNDKKFISHYLRLTHRDKVYDHLSTLADTTDKKRVNYPFLFSYLPAEMSLLCANFSTLGPPRSTWLVDSDDDIIRWTSGKMEHVDSDSEYSSQVEMGSVIDSSSDDYLSFI